jgi:hypothetical protein
MNCEAPGCGGETDVKDSRPNEQGWIRRRRCCRKCGHRFTTYEVPADAMRQRRAQASVVREVDFHVGKLAGLVASIYQAEPDMQDVPEDIKALRPLVRKVFPEAECFHSEKGGTYSYRIKAGQTVLSDRFPTARGAWRDAALRIREAAEKGEAIHG